MRAKQANLFDPCGSDTVEPSRRKTVPKIPDAQRAELIGVYRQLYEARFGERPHFTQKDGAILKRLVQEHGFDLVLLRLRAFMAIEDTHIRETTGWSIGGLSAKWHWLAAKLAARTPHVAKKTRRLAEATHEFLSEGDA